MKLALTEAGMATKWRDIGLALGLRNNQLDLIRSNNRTSEQCLTAMATEWLNKAYDMGEQGEPSLQRLSEVVGNPAGGNNPAEAEKILQNWPTNEHHNRGECATRIILTTTIATALRYILDQSFCTVALLHKNIHHRFSYIHIDTTE